VPGLLLLIAGSYLTLTLLDRFTGFLTIPPSLRGRITLSLVFLNTGLAHFTNTDGMLQLLPEFLPFRTELVYASGVLEILGAVTLLVPRLQRLTSIALVLFLIAVFPGNVYGALQHASIGGHELGPVYLLVRAPFQVFLIWMLYRFGVKSDLANRISARVSTRRPSYHVKSEGTLCDLTPEYPDSIYTQPTWSG